LLLEVALLLVSLLKIIIVQIKLKTMTGGHQSIKS
jgi:hypothetical protein